ncbi:hypothetical protein ES708_00114 [subsurface metagenome]
MGRVPGRGPNGRAGLPQGQVGDGRPLARALEVIAQEDELGDVLDLGQVGQFVPLHVQLGEAEPRRQVGADQPIGHQGDPPALQGLRAPGADQARNERQDQGIARILRQAIAPGSDKGGDAGRRAGGFIRMRLAGDVGHRLQGAQACLRARMGAGRERPDPRKPVWVDARGPDGPLVLQPGGTAIRHTDRPIVRSRDRKAGRCPGGDLGLECGHGGHDPPRVDRIAHVEGVHAGAREGSAAQEQDPRAPGLDEAGIAPEVEGQLLVDQAEDPAPGSAKQGVAERRTR